MTRTLATLLFSTAASAAVMLSAGFAAADDFAISAYGGLQSAPHSTVDITGPVDPQSHAAGWEGNSFQSPQYWGVRGTYWLDSFGYNNFGVSLDYTHAKIYADDETLTKFGYSHFEFTDGLNLLTLNGLYRMPLENSRFTPYVGAGVGINVPHVEVTRASGLTSEYQLGGATLQAQAGVDFKITDRWSAFAEYKGNYSFVDVDIDSGSNLKTEIFTNAINVGLTFHF